MTVQDIGYLAGHVGGLIILCTVCAVVIIAAVKAL